MHLRFFVRAARERVLSVMTSAAPLTLALAACGVSPVRRCKEKSPSHYLAKLKAGAFIDSG
jgi:hypothetical protein